MRKLPLFVVVTLTLTLGLAGAMLLGNPALAGISGGEVKDSWRCETFRGVSEGEMSKWLSIYAPSGPSTVLLAAGGESSGSWMVCAHGPEAVKGKK